MVLALFSLTYISGDALVPSRSQVRGRAGNEQGAGLSDRAQGASLSDRANLRGPAMSTQFQNRGSTVPPGDDTWLVAVLLIILCASSVLTPQRT